MVTIFIFVLILLKVSLFSRIKTLFFCSLNSKRLASVLFPLLITCLVSSPSFSIELKDYVVGPQDVLKIEVWDNPDLSREVTVSLRNTISFPLIGEMETEGYTVENLQQKIRTCLADGYLVNPQVTVTVKEYNSKKVYVLGEVTKPGYYPFSKVTTMVEIISMAGGLTPDAGQEAYIIRSPEKIDPKDIKHLIKGGGSDLPSETAINSSNSIPGKDSADGISVKNQVITLNLNDFNQGINLNFELQNNDTLYIPKAQFFYVIGEVKSPGRFKLEKDVNVLQTISMAGGLTQKASERKIKIIRTLEGKEHEIKVKMTDSVLPDDIIRVPESFF